MSLKSIEPLSALSTYQHEPLVIDPCTIRTYPFGVSNKGHIVSVFQS